MVKMLPGRSNCNNKQSLSNHVPKCISLIPAFAIKSPQVSLAHMGFPTCHTSEMQNILFDHILPACYCLFLLNLLPVETDNSIRGRIHLEHLLYPFHSHSLKSLIHLYLNLSDFVLYICPASSTFPFLSFLALWWEVDSFFFGSVIFSGLSKVVLLLVSLGFIHVLIAIVNWWLMFSLIHLVVDLLSPRVMRKLGHVSVII